MSDLKLYLKGVSTGYVNMLIINIIGLLLTPFVLKFVSKEEYALYYLSADILMWLSFAQLGVANSYNSLAAISFGNKNYNELGKLSSTAWSLQLLSSLVVLIVGIVLSFFVESFFKVKSTQTNVQLFFLIMVAGSVLMLMNQIYTSLLTSSKEVHISNRISIISVIPKVIFTILFLLIGWNLIGLAFANLISIIVPIVIMSYYVRKRYSFIEISIKGWTREHSKKLLYTGIWFSIGGLAGILILGLDRIVIAKVVSLELVAGYLITQKLFFLSDKVLSQVINVSRPFFGQLYGIQSFDKMKNLFDLFTKIAIFCSVFMALLIMIVNELFIDLWVGEEFYLGKIVTFFLAINFVIQFNLLPNRVILATTLYKLKSQNVLRVFEGIVNLVLSIYLGKLYGISGVIAGSIIASLLFSNIIFNFYCYKFFKINLVNTTSKLFLHYFLILILIVYFVADYFFYNPYLNLFVIVISISILTYYGYHLLLDIKNSGNINLSKFIPFKKQIT